MIVENMVLQNLLKTIKKTDFEQASAQERIDH